MFNFMGQIIDNFQSGGTLLETEHGLVMLLLLYGLLTTRGKKFTKVLPVIIIGGILLSVFTPVHKIPLFWPVITALVVPPFLWQGAVAVTKSGPHRHWGSLGVWVAAFLLLTFSLGRFSGLPLSNAMLISMLAVTLVWYFRELEVERSYLSTIGLIALVVLLAEVDLELISIQQWFGALASGTAIGIGVGFLGIYIFRKLAKNKWKNTFFFILAYAAYFVGLALEISAIATTLAAALVVSTYGYSIGLWYRQKDIPGLSKTPFFFYLASGVWLVLGWQAHTEVDPAALGGILPALAIITVSIFTVRKFSPLSVEKQWLRLLRQMAGVLLLLMGALLLWPHEAFLTTFKVEIALAAAIFLILALRASIKPLFELIGVQLSWPSE